MRGTLLIALAAVGCASERDQGPNPDFLTWKDRVDPSLDTTTDGVGKAVAAACATAGCHHGANPAGDYDLTTYENALGGGSDATPNAIAGDDSSAILAVLGDADHADFSAATGVGKLLHDWVLGIDQTSGATDATWALAYFDTPIHPPTFLNPAAGNDTFHGKELEARGWDFALCGSCHGEHFDDGPAPSCKTCHQDGPTGCRTCHGQPPATGAHLRHVEGGPLDHPLACTECHVKPARWDTPGHILADATPGKAEITFGDAANADPLSRRTGPATYDAETKTCTNIYCHGGAFADTTAQFPEQSWDGTADTVACGGCHGLGPADHHQTIARTDCITCHPRTVDAAGQILPAAHLDGQVQFGDGSGKCTGCHGDATSPAPPRGVHGETSTTTLAVGAHRSHVIGGRLRGPIACAECHVTPTEVADAGHLDGDMIAEVFPAAAGPVSRADGATPTWDRAAGTCATVYCHGGGAKLANDSSPYRIRTPLWTDVNDGVSACGSCHGIPPTDAVHTRTPALQLSDCHTCHRNSVDAYGNILFTGPPDALTSKHINGDPDYTP